MGDQLGFMLGRLEELNAYSAKDLLLFLVKRHRRLGIEMASLRRAEWQWCNASTVETLSVSQIRLALDWIEIDSEGSEQDVRSRLREARLTGRGRKIRGKEPPRNTKRVKLSRE
jgi:hypothetical protein